MCGPLVLTQALIAAVGLPSETGQGFRKTATSEATGEGSESEGSAYRVMPRGFNYLPKGSTPNKKIGHHQKRTTLELLVKYSCISSSQRLYHIVKA